MFTSNYCNQKKTYAGKTGFKRRTLYRVVCVCSILGAVIPARTYGKPAVLFLANPGFENGKTNWSLDKTGTIEKGKVSAGRGSLRIKNKDRRYSINVHSGKIPVNVPGIYEVSGKILPVSGSGLAVFLEGFDASGKQVCGSGGIELPSLPAKRWQNFAFVFTVSPKAKYLSLKFGNICRKSATLDVCIDELKIKFMEDKGKVWQKDLAKLKQRLLEKLLPNKTKPVNVGDLVKKQRPDGSWPDIDYANHNISGWQPRIHFHYLYKLACAYRCGATDPKITKKILADAVSRGIEYWYANKPYCKNWWWNEIAVPRNLYRILLLAEPGLSAETLKRGCEITAKAKLGMDGQNLVWVAECNIARGCLENDPYITGEACERMAQEMQIKPSGEGIKPDFSFHQHYAQLYSGGYGLYFAQDATDFAVLTEGTSFGLDKKVKDTLICYILDGEQWMVRNKVFDYSACGREIVRPNSCRSKPLEKVCDQLATLNHPRTPELKTFATRLRQGISSKTPALNGNRFFWNSAYCVQHRPEYFASVRLASRRLRLSEVINGENLLGEHLSDGLNYIYRSGEEYQGIMPVWDWRKLPGVTSEQMKEPPATVGWYGMRTFAGGVSDGKYGVAAMDFAARKGKLIARKAWFFFDKEYVCLGSRIRCPSDNPVLTVLNQCLLNGEVTIEDDGGKRKLEKGEHKLSNVRRVCHDGIAYVLPVPGPLTVRNTAQTGSWSRINRSGSKNSISKDVFSIWIDHGKQVKDGTYAYIVAPGANKDEAEGSSPEIQILANRETLQAVYHKGLKRGEFVFYQRGSIDMPGIGRVSVDIPCILMISRSEGGISLYAADPDHSRKVLTASINGQWTGTGAKAAGGRTRIKIPLPDAPGMAGSTVHISLKPAENQQ